MTADTHLLDVRALTVRFPRVGVVAAHDVTFTIDAGEQVALVGASGSGKSVTALALLGLFDPGAVRDPASRIQFDGVELTSLDDTALRALRGRRIAMIFQEPSAALNPAMSIREQVAETALVHGSSRATALDAADAMLARVGLDPSLGGAFPHELSGGQCQRVMIAMALVLRPALIVADEPTSALDTLTQAQLLELLRDLQREHGCALLLVTHDVGIVGALCTRALVMHEGRIVEDAPVSRLLAAPAHPVTAELLRAVPPLRGTP